MAITLQPFTGFWFNGHHSSEFGLTRVSEGTRYNENLLADFKDTTQTVPGRNGTLYWDSYYTQKKFLIKVAFDNMTEEQLLSLRKWLDTKNFGELIFDESPYKAYRCKTQSSPQLQYICFDEEINERPSSNIIHNHELNITTSGSTSNIVPMQRIYKGEGTITFVCYDGYARGLASTIDDIYQVGRGLDVKLGYSTPNEFLYMMQSMLVAGAMQKNTDSWVYEPKQRRGFYGDIIFYNYTINEIKANLESQIANFKPYVLGNTTFYCDSKSYNNMISLDAAWSSNPYSNQHTNRTSLVDWATSTDELTQFSPNYKIYYTTNTASVEGTRTTNSMTFVPATNWLQTVYAKYPRWDSTSTTTDYTASLMHSILELLVGKLTGSSLLKTSTLDLSSLLDNSSWRAQGVFTNFFYDMIKSYREFEPIANAAYKHIINSRKVQYASSTNGSLYTTSTVTLSNWLETLYAKLAIPASYTGLMDIENICRRLMFQHLYYCLVTWYLKQLEDNTKVPLYMDGSYSLSSIQSSCNSFRNIGFSSYNNWYLGSYSSAYWTRFASDVVVPSSSKLGLTLSNNIFQSFPIIDNASFITPKNGWSLQFSTSWTGQSFLDSITNLTSIFKQPQLAIASLNAQANKLIPQLNLDDAQVMWSEWSAKNQKWYSIPKVSAVTRTIFPFMHAVDWTWSISMQAEWQNVGYFISTYTQAATAATGFNNDQSLIWANHSSAKKYYLDMNLGQGTTPIQLYLDMTHFKKSQFQIDLKTATITSITDSSIGTESTNTRTVAELSNFQQANSSYGVDKYLCWDTAQQAIYGVRYDAQVQQWIPTGTLYNQYLTTSEWPLIAPNTIFRYSSSGPNIIYGEFYPYWL